MARDIIEENPNLKVIKTKNEDGRLPCFIFKDDKEYGICVDERQYMLCKKKQGNKIVKDEDGNPLHIETYYKWESFKYSGTFESIIECYCEIKEKLKMSEFNKNAEFKDLVKIRNDIKNTITKSLSLNGINKEFLQCADLIDTKEKLKEQIVDIQLELAEIIKQKDNLISLIKEQRKIVIDQSPSTNSITRKGKRKTNSNKDDGDWDNENETEIKK